MNRQNSGLKKFLIFNFVFSFFVLIFSFISSSHFAYADTALTMAFIYPGGEGSAEDAQPYLDKLFATIHENKGPVITGTYYQSAEEGLKAVKSKKVQLGIVSLDFYLEKKKTLPMEVFLSTLPMVGPGPSEHYVVMVQKNVESLKKGALTEIYSSRPLADSFVKTVLFQAESNDFLGIPIVSGSTIIPTLKKISTGEIRSAVLLNSFEFGSLKNLDADWFKNLKVLYTSSIIPSSPVVLFSSLPDELRMQLMGGMLKVGQTKEGKELLENLRLKGFVLPQAEAYERLDSASKAAKAAPKIPASSPN